MPLLSIENSVKIGRNFIQIFVYDAEVSNFDRKSLLQMLINAFKYKGGSAAL